MNHQKSLTILTPTYNRVYLLDRLYQSLTMQTCKDFVWLIIDDGSTDETRNAIEALINEKKIDIRYYYKENGGKHTAINYAMSYIDSELVFIVDSDDYLTEDACETILLYHKKYRHSDNLCGYSFLRMYPDGKINNVEFPSNELIESYIECRVNRSIGGDKAEVYYSSCLKEFPFPEFPKERFLNEDVVWIRMGRKYKMVHINKAIYVGDYLGDGLTKKGKVLKILNPLGGMERGRELMSRECKLRVRINGAIQYIVFAKFSKKKNHEIITGCKYNYLVFFLYPIGCIIYYIFKRKNSLKG